MGCFGCKRLSIKTFHNRTEFVFLLTVVVCVSVQTVREECSVCMSLCGSETLMHRTICACAYGFCK